jgi:hypothetical protein
MSAVDFEGHLDDPIVDGDISTQYIDYGGASLFPELEPEVHWTAKDKLDCKRYTELLRSVLKVRCMLINLYPAGCPTTVNLLYGNGQCVALCHYCPSATFNAYCYLLKQCDADGNLLVTSIQDKSISSCEDYYAVKMASGTVTPPLKVPR